MGTKSYSSIIDIMYSIDDNIPEDATKAFKWYQIASNYSLQVHPQVQWANPSNNIALIINILPNEYGTDCRYRIYFHKYLMKKPL